MKKRNLGSLLQLQDYGSNESEDEDGEPPEEKKRLPLPLPSLPSYKVCRRITRDPLLKVDERKVRNFPHEPGSWATFIYLPISVKNDLLDFTNELLHMLPSMEISTVEDFHVSVTKTFSIKHHWIKDFTDSVYAVIRSIKPFYINLSGFKVYLNENKTRTFIGLRVVEGTQELEEIVQCLNKCLASYNLPQFYDSPSFHMSILWCVGDKSIELKDHLDTLNKTFHNFNFFEKVYRLQCNTGNKKFNLYFDR